MRYWYDTEFLEDGKTIELISIGIVAEDGREYYAVSSDMPAGRIKKHPWLMDNVWPHLPLTSDGELDASDACVKPRQVIANEVREFLSPEHDVELWGYFASYDHVVLAQLFGTMVTMPRHIPMFTNDIMQIAKQAHASKMPVINQAEHHALADAQWTRNAYDWLTTIWKETRNA